MRWLFDIAVLFMPVWRHGRCDYMCEDTLILPEIIAPVFIRHSERYTPAGFPKLMSAVELGNEPAFVGREFFLKVASG